MGRLVLLLKDLLLLIEIISLLIALINHIQNILVNSITQSG